MRNPLFAIIDAQPEVISEQLLVGETANGELTIIDRLNPPNQLCRVQHTTEVSDCYFGSNMAINEGKPGITDSSDEYFVGDIKLIIPDEIEIFPYQ